MVQKGKQKREGKKEKVLVLALASALVLILLLNLTSATIAGCNLQIVKCADKTNVKPGDIVLYTLKYTNIGNAVCTGGGVKIQDVLNSNLEYLNYTTYIVNDTDAQGLSLGHEAHGIIGFNATTNTLTWNAHVVSPGEEGRVLLRVRVLQPQVCGDFQIPNYFKSWSNEEGWKTSNTIGLSVDYNCPNCPICGDGIINQANETCDDGDRDNNDGCSSNCKSEFCGDGIKQSNEECDDGDLENGDGCSSTCALEQGCNLELVKSMNKNNVKPGDIVTYSLKYKNTGDRVCTGGGVKIQDTLNQNLNYSGNFTKNILNDIDGQGLDSGWYEIPGYNKTTNTLTWNAYVVSPNEEGTITFNVKVLTPTQCGDFQIPNYFRAWGNKKAGKTAILLIFL